MATINNAKRVRIAKLYAVAILFMTVNSVSAVETVSQIELTNQLLLKLEARDKIIADLQGRVKRLENRVDVGSPSKANQYNESKIQNQHTKTASAKSKSSVGSFEVDEIAAERALERTLVQTGALLLPFGQAEIQPFSTYTRRESSALELLQVNNNLLVGVNREARRNEIDAGLFVRVGLPFEAQAEFRLPGRIVNESQIRKQNTIGLNNVEVSDNTGYALGDISIGIAKTLMREDGWLPDLVGRFTWDTDSGDLIDNKVSMGTGFNDVIVSLTALKRQDPLAFTGTVSYQKTFKEFGIEPGDKFNLSVNASLAASPQTSLSIGLQQSFSKKTKINDVEIDGTDTTTSALIFGASSTIGRRMFFSLFAGIGLTESSPDYFVNIAIPLRFDIPFKSLSSLEF